jgi:small subunit ribosomal protein S20
MPNTKSAKKRHQQSVVRRERNRAVKSSLKTQIRKTLEKIKGGNVSEAQTELSTTAKKLDKAAAAKIIHPNRAARVKSRLSHRIKAAKATAK